MTAYFLFLHPYPSTFAFFYKSAHEAAESLKKPCPIHPKLKPTASNIQNLYKVGNPREIQKIQDEFYSIYKKDDMELLENFAKQLDIIAEGYKAQSIR